MEDRSASDQTDDEIPTARVNTESLVRHVPNTAFLLGRDPDLNGVDTYTTHFNGGRPFKVEIKSSVVTIYDNHRSETEPLMVFTDICKLFVGKSPLTPMTEFSGGHGKDFDGNSILIQTESLRYVFVGHVIYSFDAISPIVSYVSEVGNNDVPYPYAVDEHDNVYLMIENVIVKNNIGTTDPYSDLFYHPVNKSSRIAEATGGIVSLIGTDYDCDQYDREQTYRVSWQRDAKAHYNRPWMSDLRAVYNDGTTRYLSENDYIIMMSQIGDALGFREMKTDLLFSHG